MGAAAWGLRRLPAVLLAAPVPLAPVPLTVEPQTRTAPPPPPLDPVLAEADARLADRVLDLLDGERVWLDPDLTVETLADRLREPTRDVSRVLNGPVGGGFHQAVGRRRVAEAQRQLRDDPDATVLGVAFEVGFNSKSAFHRAFRRHAGMTPTAYRRALAEAGGDGQQGGQGVPVPVPGRSAPAPG